MCEMAGAAWETFRRVCACACVCVCVCRTTVCTCVVKKTDARYTAEYERTRVGTSWEVGGGEGALGGGNGGGYNLTLCTVAILNLSKGQLSEQLQLVVFL